VFSVSFSLYLDFFAFSSSAQAAEHPKDPYSTASKVHIAATVTELTLDYSAVDDILEKARSLTNYHINREELQNLNLKLNLMIGGTYPVTCFILLLLLLHSILLLLLLILLCLLLLLLLISTTSWRS